MKSLRVRFHKSFPSAFNVIGAGEFGFVPFLLAEQIEGEGGASPRRAPRSREPGDF